MYSSQDEEILVLKKKIKFLEKENASLRREIHKLHQILITEKEPEKEQVDKYLKCEACSKNSVKLLELNTRNGTKKYFVCKNCNKTKPT